MSAKRTGPEKAVDELRKRIASEAEIIVHETMPRKVRHAPPRRELPSLPRAAPTRAARGASAGGACLRNREMESLKEARQGGRRLGAR